MGLTVTFDLSGVARLEVEETVNVLDFINPLAGGRSGAKGTALDLAVDIVKQRVLTEKIDEYNHTLRELESNPPDYALEYKALIQRSQIDFVVHLQNPARMGDGFAELVARDVTENSLEAFVAWADDAGLTIVEREQLVSDIGEIVSHTPGTTVLFENLDQALRRLDSPEALKMLEFERSLIVEDTNHCFLADTPIQMWPLDPSVQPRADGSYDKQLVLSHVWNKPIGDIQPKDIVMSYDSEGKLVPGRVVRTMRNTATHILDFWGTGVTPGHAYLCGEGEFQGQHVPILDILRTDGAIVKDDGTLVRASTGCDVGSTGDELLHVIIGDEQPDGQVTISEVGQIRSGTRLLINDGQDVSILDLVSSNGATITEDGYVQTSSNGAKLPFRWTFTASLPKPEDYILERSGVSIQEIYTANEWEQIGTRLLAPHINRVVSETPYTN